MVGNKHLTTMKFNIKSIAIALAALALAGCNKAAIDPMKGIYAAPVDVKLTSNTVDYAKDGKNRIVTFNLKGDKDVTIQFVSKTYELKPNTYTEGKSSEMKPGLYNADLSKVGTETISFGSLVFAVNEEGVYNLSGVVQCGENTRYRLAWSGKIEWKEEEVEAADYLYTLVKEQGETALKQSLILTKDGEAAGLLELYTALDATSFTGTFVSTEYASQPGQMGNYWEFPDWGISGGSYIIYDGVKVKMEPGASVTITLDPATGWYKLDLPGGISTTMDAAPIALENVFQASGNAENHTYTIKLGEAGVIGVPNAFGGVDYSGEGSIVSIDLYTEDGTLAAGEYEVADGVPAEMGKTPAPGTCVAGYVFAGWGFPMNWGSVVSTVGGPEVLVLSGKIVVEKTGGVYSIAINTNAGNFSYTGDLKVEE